MSNQNRILRKQFRKLMAFEFMHRFTSPVTLGYLSALVAAMAYGVTNVLGKKLVTDFGNPLVVATFTTMFGMLIFALFVGKQTPKEIKKAPRRSRFFIVLAGITATAGLAMMYAALTQARVIIVAPIAALNPLIAILLAHLFLRRLERVTLRIVVGALLVMAGVTAITLDAVT
jgi:uncharacterized membrane protein